MSAVKLVRSAERRKQLGLSNRERKTGSRKTGGHGVMFNSGGWLVKTVVEGKRVARSFPADSDGYRRARRWYHDMRDERRRHRALGDEPFVMECKGGYNAVYWMFGRRTVRKFPCHDYDAASRGSALKLATAFCLIVGDPEAQAVYRRKPIEIRA